jgi:immune inhibitor A
MIGNRSNTSAVVAGIVVVLCCVCVVFAGLAWYGYFAIAQFSPSLEPTALPLEVSTPTSTPEPQIVRPLAEPVYSSTLETLQNTIVPPNDPWDLACRLKGLCNVPRVMATSAPPRFVGDTKSFWVHNLDTKTNNRVQATLRYVTPHMYLWVEDGVNYNERELKALAEEFEYRIYPTTREFFGEEWSPGIDGDEHIYILYARGLGFSVAGYFSSADSIHPLIRENSNGHEMFLFNADNTPLGSSFTYGVLAHEFQHMIHWNQDPNETSWLNEGASELAAFINGYDPGGFDWFYINNPDLQLNDWPNNPSATRPHYGAGFLFMTYFLDRFGEDATKALVRHPANGLESVDLVLEGLNASDPLTGRIITADAFFMDWAVTNFLLDKAFGDGRFIYNNYPGARRASPTERINRCPQAPGARTVRQYGVHYISIECRGEYTLSFSGSTTTRLLPVDPYSGEYAFWSNKGDESDMTLTREFDFTSVSAPIEMTFRAWYDIETDWDYLYLVASEDGERWEILLTPSGTGTNPTGNSYGWGYTGVSGDWIEERIDLSRFAGKKVFLRFEYITDAAVNGEGFLLDDVEVAAINYRSDFEADDGGWQADGFARIQNVLPQTFGLALLLTSDSSVTMIPLSADQTVDIPISLKSGEQALLVISGTTRFTREPASYQLEIR